MQDATTTFLPKKENFITFNFKRQLNFTNIFNATADFATV